MSIYQRVTHQLEQLVSKGPKHMDTALQYGSQGYIVGVSADGKGAEASLRLTDFDRYSVVLQHLEVADRSLIINSNIENYLHQCAAEISQRLTYLEEPLVLLELDTIEGMAQLRSFPPRQTTEETIYWELTLWTVPYPHAKLTRYRWCANSYERHPIFHPVTSATLARIADDLVGCLVT